MIITRQELDSLKVRAADNQFAEWNPGKRDWGESIAVPRLIADLVRARELLKRVRDTEWAEYRRELLAYLIDAGAE